jgi:hypothetical protein
MQFCKINLSNTNYSLLPNARVLTYYERDEKFSRLLEIYNIYCKHKKFISVMPLFKSVLLEDNVDVFAYYDLFDLAAFSIVKKYDKENVESVQFAWDYYDPKMRLGIKSIMHECAFYKSFNYKYLYLGQVDNYKKQFDGYEDV